MRTIPRYAVIPTHNRHEQLASLVKSLEPQCDSIIVIDNASDPALSELWLKSQLVEPKKTSIFVFHDPEQPPNLSRLWNKGIDAAKLGCDVFRDQRWDVAILNDDAVVPSNWWDAVSGAMREVNAAAASADPFGELPLGRKHLWLGNAPQSVYTRLAGWAFMLRGEAGLRADERLRWWYADDLLSLQAREGGGLVHVGGVAVSNTGANSSTVGVLAEQAGRDRQTFVDITGRQPW